MDLMHSSTNVILVCILIILILCPSQSFEQVPSDISDSTLSTSGVRIKLDSNVFRFATDTIRSVLKEKVQSKKNRGIEHFKSIKGRSESIATSLLKDSLPKNLVNPYADLIHFSKPLVRFNGGYVGYDFSYRSNTDTPYSEKNISQHSIKGSAEFALANTLPFTASFWVRRTNSQVFRDLSDVQIVFNSEIFKNQLLKRVTQRITNNLDEIKSYNLQALYYETLSNLSKEGNWLNSPVQLQRVIEANETLKVPSKYFNRSIPDSINSRIIDSLQRLATTFLKEYERRNQHFNRLSMQRDSIKRQYDKSINSINEYKKLLSARDMNFGSIKNVSDSMKQQVHESITIPSWLKWMMGIRKLSVGRSPLEYSELTAKNMSLNGINFEYNSWYYLAFSAGFVDFRFREFAVKRRTAPQYIYMVRGGIGKLERNYLILSAYKGEKQLFTIVDTSGKRSSINVTGISAEAKISLNENNYLIAEVAETFSPNIRSKPPITDSRFDNSTKAFSVKAFSVLPVTATRFEGMVKYTGADFQSFSIYQTSSSARSWYIKADQYLFHRKLKLLASLRSNDFSNPYILQNYKSNTVFKTFTASFRAKSWPSFMIGYMPLSQLTSIDNQIVENKFHTLTGSITHNYKIGLIRASSMGVVSKFYNRNADTASLYYGASNLLIGHSMFFDQFTANLNFSRSVTQDFVLNVSSEDVTFKISKRGSIGLGVKFNNYNNSENKVGEFINLNYQIGKADYVTLNLEHGYLPGSSGNLVVNDFGSIQFLKRF